MNYSEHLEAKRTAEQAGFPAHSACLTAEDGEVYAVRIQDVEAGRSLTFLHLGSVVEYITAVVEKGMALAG
jgi:hypothetical protein